MDGVTETIMARGRELAMTMHQLDEDMSRLGDRLDQGQRHQLDALLWVLEQDAARLRGTLAQNGR